MSEPAFETSPIYATEIGELADPEADFVLQALQSLFGDEGLVRNYDAYLRKEYEGDDTTCKNPIGSTLLVECVLFSAAGGFTEQVLEEPPVDENAHTRLTALATKNWYKKQGWIRNKGRNL